MTTLYKTKDLLFPMCLSFSRKTASSCEGLAGCPPTAPATGSTLTGDGAEFPLLVPSTTPDATGSLLLVFSTGAGNQNEM